MSPVPPSQQPPVAHVERPWGAFDQYVNNAPSTVTLMTVEPGQRLSLQSHRDRAELWIVLDPGAIVQIGEEVHHPEAGAQLWIAPGQRHRLSSAGERVRVLEVAFGNWQQEDIVRYDDDYNRPAEGE